MTFNITRGKIATGQRIVLYGTEGIGKSTFASHFPDPLFIDTEGSTHQLDVRRFDPPTSWTMLESMAKHVRDNPDLCETLVVDTVDWAEKLAIQHTCWTKNISAISDLAYGAGYVQLAVFWGAFLDLLTEITEKGIHVVLLAHTQVKKFERPEEMGAYDRWELKLDKRTASLTKEWADCLLFANYKITVIEDSKTKSKKATGGRRVMYTLHNPAWDAKNRYGLPEICDFNADVILEHFQDVKGAKNENKSQEATENKQEEKSEPPKEISKGEEIKNKQLRELMALDGITAKEIEDAVADQGYFPRDTKINNYPDDFIGAVLVSAWDSVKKSILNKR